MGGPWAGEVAAVAGQVEKSWVPVLQEAVLQVPALAELRKGALSAPRH